MCNECTFDEVVVKCAGCVDCIADCSRLTACDSASASDANPPHVELSLLSLATSVRLAPDQLA